MGNSVPEIVPLKHRKRAHTSVECPGYFLCSAPVHRQGRHVFTNHLDNTKLEALPGRTGTIEVGELMRPQYVWDKRGYEAAGL
jgi:hypothetical protein